MKDLGSVTEDINAVLGNIKKSVMRDLRVATFGKVVAVDVSKFTVDVQPLIKEKINTPEGYKYIKLPLLKGVRYINTQNPKPNQFAVCIHFDRSISGFDFSNPEYIESGENRHNLNDSFAIVLKTSGASTVVEDFDEVNAALDDIISRVSIIESFDTDISGRVATLEDPNTEMSKAAVAKEVTEKIGGKNITDIFEGNGTTVKNATNSTSSTNATNATNLVSGGTIASNVTAVTQAVTDNSKKVATTEFVNKFYMTTYTGTVTAVSHYKGASISSYYMVKDKNNVELTITYPSYSGSDGATSGSNVTVFSVRLQSGFYNTSTQITTIPTPASTSHSYSATISTSGVLTCKVSSTSSSYIPASGYTFRFTLENN